ncbi:hypothetical protein R1flu_004823 [Riccia fluitans]|uniref:Essential protein Yae1 N-terminal domain-containing protein n=1 Tax=Riccia fluitans TaxID=41844 RepID=A0ABD1YSD4_9MARC
MKVKKALWFDRTYRPGNIDGSSRQYLRAVLCTTRLVVREASRSKGRSVAQIRKLRHPDSFDEGFADGIEAGREEGREVGLKTGFEVGEEIGFYTGCADIWSATVDIDDSAFSARARRSIKQLEELLRAYPLSNPEDERVTDSLDKIRLKFQAVLSMLSLQLDYPGHPKARSAEDVSF